jgi:N,N-dimethylformamidase
MSERAPAESAPGDPIGYSDVWSAAPGETLRFMVSTTSATYEAELVRLSGKGPEFETPVASSIDGVYQGRHQAARAGSCVRVEGAEAFAKIASLSICIWVWPTRPQTGTEQVLLSGGSGALVINRAGMGLLRVDTEHGRSELPSTRPLTERAWTFICGSYDARTGQLNLYSHETGLYAPPAAAVTCTVPPGALAPFGSAAVYIAVETRAPAGSITWGTRHFDGKLEAPTLYNRALSARELTQIVASDGNAAFPIDGMVAAWRFQHGMEGDRVTDIGPFALHGLAINSPTRAMTGHAWRALSQDPRASPDEYGAIHFHADDLEDAAWESDFALRIPDDLSSGIYAIKLTTAGGGADLVPFIVRPTRDHPTAKIAFIVPTITYLAYANERAADPATVPAYLFPNGLTITPWDQWLARHPELSYSSYDRHADGSGFCYSSRLRPIPSLRPNYLASVFPYPRHLPADLFFLEWLDCNGFRADFLTDEDLESEGVAVLAKYDVVITGSHPEYVTQGILDALQDYIGGGGRIMNLGGNGYFWITSYKEPRRHLIEIRRGLTNEAPWSSRPGECHHSTTGELGGVWELRGRLPRALFGVGATAAGLTSAKSFTRTAVSKEPRYAWVFKGLKDDQQIGGGGVVMGDAAGFEIDRCDVSLGSPPSTVVLASADLDELGYQVIIPGVTLSGKPPAGAPPYARADMTLVETSSGGAVFSVGSVCWVGSLNIDHGSNSVSIVTRNVLERFLQTALPTSARER